MRLGALESPLTSSKTRSHKTFWILPVFCSLAILGIFCFTMWLELWARECSGFCFKAALNALSRLCLGQILKCKRGAFLALALCCKSYSAMFLGCILEGFYTFDLHHSPAKHPRKSQPISPQEQGNIWAYKIFMGRWPTFCLCPWRKRASITCCSDVPSCI